jgi:hypothetical protein
MTEQQQQKLVAKAAVANQLKVAQLITAPSAQHQSMSAPQKSLLVTSLAWCKTRVTVIPESLATSYKLYAADVGQHRTSLRNSGRALPIKG